LKNIYNKINYINRGYNSDEINELKNNKHYLVEKLIQKIQKLKQQKNLYLEEINNYEIYLINKELGLIEINESKDNINVKEIKNINNCKEISIFDNLSKVLENQSLFIVCKEDLKNFLKVFLTNLNSKRKILYNSIHSNSSDLVNFIYTELSNLNEFFKEEIKLLNKNIIDNNISNNIDIDNLVKFKAYYLEAFLIYFLESQ